MGVSFGFVKRHRAAVDQVFVRSYSGRTLLGVLPSLSDWIFIAVLAWLLGYALSGMDLGLLTDASTGCHIRTGEFVLQHGQAPRTDMLSFTRAGQPWFAWEWLSDVLFALLYRALALKGVVVFSSALIAFTVWLAARHAIQRGANCLIVIALLHLVIGASSMQYLARPHLFTLFFCAIAFRLIDADLETRSRRIWALVPLTVLWANLHPGFFVLIVSAAILAVGRACEAAFEPRGRQTCLIDAGRYAILAGACLAVSGLNPYGFASHRHIMGLLQAPWVSNLVEEFRPPDFHAAQGMYFEVLLFAGVAVAAWMIRRGEFARALLILAWAHASLLSGRSIPIYALLVFPILAVTASEMLQQTARDPFGFFSTVRAIGRDYRGMLGRFTPWPPVAVAAALALCLLAPPIDFPEGRYPTGLVTREAGVLASARVFSTDSWSDYLTYRFYPQSRIFMDGRNDFFGEDLAQQYLDVLNAKSGWDNVLRKYGADVALVPASSPLATVLGQSADWKTIDRDSAAVLAVRFDNLRPDARP
jgi:hypothetical protein